MGEGSVCLVAIKLVENDITKIESSKREHIECNVDHTTSLQTFKRRKVSAFRTFPKGCGRNAPSLGEPNVVAGELLTTHNNLDVASKPKSASQLQSTPVFASIKASNDDNIAVHGIGRQSAFRKFPFGCGRNVKELSIEECQNYLDSRTKNVDDNSMIISPTKFTPRKAITGTSESYSNSTELDRRVVSEILESDETESNGLDYFRGKEITLALMATANCPWMIGKGSQGPSDLGTLCFGNGDSKVRKGEMSKESKLGLKRQSSLRFLDDEVLSLKVDSDDMNKNDLVVKELKPCDSCNQFNGSSSSLGGDVALDDVLTVSTVSPNAKAAKCEKFVRLIPFGNPPKNKSARRKVRETLRLFQTVVRKLLQDSANLNGHAKLKGQALRVDFKASKILKEKNKWVNTGKPILGHVPGVEVGDEFRYRIELCMVGLHRNIQAGIDFRKEKDKIILATSIVASTSYHDDLESADVLVYSGQGGGLLDGNKKSEDQKLERGNLGLKNCIEKMSPVRVIRGFKETKNGARNSSKGKIISTYTYDGLYQVEKYWEERNPPHDALVYKFLLRRLPSQPELAWKIVKEVKNSKKFEARLGICVEDMSKGKEKFPVACVNTMDDQQPSPFNYITRMIYPPNYQHMPLNGCDCKSKCCDTKSCSCVVKNGGEIPFNYDGAIVEEKPLVYECGPTCKCPPSCYNRVSQDGIKFPLEVFKTESRGWGVRSLTSIPSGSFICEYVGEVLRDKDADKLDNDEYLFEIGNNYHDQSLSEGLSTVMPISQTPASSQGVEDGLYVIDAARYGNVGRFINHSCTPNLYAQNVLYDHDDKSLPHIMMFAAENIPPLQELTYHYNYKIDQVRDSEGNIKRKYCYCGSDECTGRLY